LVCGENVVSYEGGSLLGSVSTITSAFKLMMLLLLYYLVLIPVKPFASF
jgi:hypothetical protein